MAALTVPHTTVPVLPALPLGSRVLQHERVQGEKFILVFIGDAAGQRAGRALPQAGQRWPQEGTRHHGTHGERADHPAGMPWRGHWELSKEVGIGDGASRQVQCLGHEGRLGLLAGEQVAPELSSPSPHMVTTIESWSRQGKIKSSDSDEKVKKELA